MNFIKEKQLRIILLSFSLVYWTSLGLADQKESIIIKNAKKIDVLVMKKSKKDGKKLGVTIDDYTFLRRTYLTVVGRIPTYREINLFLQDKEKSKRKNIIVNLLQSPGYVSHQSNFWSDILRVQSRTRNNQARNFGAYFFDWIKKSIEKNKPYDQFVNEMLSTSGDIWSDEGGALGHLFRDYKMPMDSLSNTVQVFLGTRMQCAQCHDHPFDRWTQKDFYQLAAYQNGMQYNSRDNLRDFNQLLTKHQVKRGNKSPLTFFLNRSVRPTLGAAITNEGNGHIKLPHDYQYDDAKPHEVVFAKVPFGKAEPLEYVKKRQRKNKKRKNKNNKKRIIPVAEFHDNQSRQVFANWLTSRNNPRFTLTITNRLWKQVMGMGLIEPIDDLRDHTQASNPELISFLTKMMKSYNYNLKDFLKTLYFTDLFQRESMVEDQTFNQQMVFTGPLMKRLSAEQLWDSIMTMKDPFLDKRRNHVMYTARHKLYRFLKEKDEKNLNGMIKDLVHFSRTNNLEKLSKKEQRQVFSRKFSELGHESIFGNMKKQNKRNKRKNKKNKLSSASMKIAIGDDIKMNSNMDELISQFDVRPQYYRASELTLPEKPGHFLFQLGQSSKEEIDAQHTEANVPQLLTFFNGLEKNVINVRDTWMFNVFRQEKSAQKIIEVLFLSTLTRMPKQEELKDMLSIIEESKHKIHAYQDILWVLINTHEFKFLK